jgi:hypothetical protein
MPEMITPARFDANCCITTICVETARRVAAARGGCMNTKQAIRRHDA